MVIFDLDQTLVDTEPFQHLRRPGGWNTLMKQLAKVEVYDGVHELLDELQSQARPLAIVTKSPDMIPRGLIKLHNWPIPHVVGFHNVEGLHKPHPRGLLLAINAAGADPRDVVHVGDRPEDTEAARAAGVIAIGAAWGLADASELKASEPDELFETVEELSRFVLEKSHRR